MAATAVFILMDDIGALIWRGFSRFIGPVDEPDGEGDRKAPELATADAAEPVKQKRAAE